MMNTQIVAEAAVQVQPKAMSQPLSGEVRIAKQGGEAKVGADEFMQLLEQLLGSTGMDGTALQAQLQGELMNANDKKSAENGALLIAELLAQGSSLSAMLPQLMAMMNDAEGNGALAAQQETLKALQAVAAQPIQAWQGTDKEGLLAQLMHNTAGTADAHSTQQVTDTATGGKAPEAQPQGYAELIAQLESNAAQQGKAPTQGTAQAQTISAGTTQAVANVTQPVVAELMPQASELKAELMSGGAQPDTPVVKQTEALATGEAEFAKAVAEVKAEISADSSGGGRHSDAKQEQSTAEHTQAEAKQGVSDEAKAEIKQEPKANKQENKDITAQQSDFAQRLTTQEARPIQSAPIIDKEAILEQVTKGATENAAKGKQDFVMKLTPEGLGEITVKLAQQDGHITMQLTAANSNVQKLLASELEALREAMRPYKVEVREVQAQAQQHFDMSGNQQEAQQQHRELAQQFAFAREQQQRASSYYYGAAYGGTRNAAEAISTIAQPVLLSRAIDRYV